MTVAVLVPDLGGKDTDPRVLPPDPQTLSLLRLAADRLRQLTGEMGAILTLCKEEPQALPSNYVDKIREYASRIEAGAQNIPVILDTLSKFAETPARQCFNPGETLLDDSAWFGGAR